MSIGHIHGRVCRDHVSALIVCRASGACREKSDNMFGEIVVVNAFKKMSYIRILMVHSDKVFNNLTDALHFTQAFIQRRSRDFFFVTSKRIKRDQSGHHREGQPYKLQIANEGTVKHYFTAPEFFKAIATRKVQSNADGEIKAPYFLALEVFPGRSLDLYFIPARKGSYPLICTIEGHADHGMTGTIEIE